MIKLAERFAVSDIAHKRIERYKPQFLGIGGQHVVYSFPDFPDIVAKVEGLALVNAAEAKFKGVPGNNRADMEAENARTARRLDTMRNFFGEEHVLPQTFHYFHVPINQRILIEVYTAFGQGHPPPENVTSNQLRSRVSLQGHEPQLSNPDRVSFTGGYAERDRDETPKLIAAYERVTNATVLPGKRVGSLDMIDFLTVHHEMLDLVETAHTNPQVKASVSEFVARAIDYTAATGEILDLAGDDNVAFFRDGSQWTYKLTDALFPTPPPIGGWSVNLEGLMYFIADGEGASLDWGERNMILNPLNYARSINGMAEWLGLEGRIHLLPEDFGNIEAADIFHTLKKKR